MEKNYVTPYDMEGKLPLKQAIPLGLLELSRKVYSLKLTKFYQFLSCKKIFLQQTIYSRRISSRIRRIDSLLIIVCEYISEDQRLYCIPLHSVCRYPVEQLLLQCGKETLHPRIVIAVIYTAQTLLYASLH